MQMNNTEHHWNYMENCERLVAMLDKSLDLIMNHIFQGKCKNPQELDSLFKAVNQAVFMKEYLSVYGSNLQTIAEEFLIQVHEWQDELQNKLY
jgi:hypothetical protein